MIKRILFGLLGILAVAIVLAVQLSPWPSVAIIQHAFSRGDQVIAAALGKGQCLDHVIILNERSFPGQVDPRKFELLRLSLYQMESSRILLAFLVPLRSCRISSRAE